MSESNDSSKIFVIIFLIILFLFLVYMMGFIGLLVFVAIVYGYYKWMSSSNKDGDLRSPKMVKSTINNIEEVENNVQFAPKSKNGFQISFKNKNQGIVFEEIYNKFKVNTQIENQTEAKSELYKIVGSPLRNDYFQNLLTKFDLTLSDGEFIINSFIKYIKSKYPVKYDPNQKNINFSASLDTKRALRNRKAEREFENRRTQRDDLNDIEMRFSKLSSVKSEQNLLRKDEEPKVFENFNQVNDVNEHSNQRIRNVSKSIRINVFERDNYTCQICGRNVKEDNVKLEIDHIIPVSKGGSDDISNLQTLCFDCNRGKSNKILHNQLNR
jgi:hypothetical protein